MSDKDAIFIFEPEPGSAKRLESLAEHLGYDTVTATTTEQAPAALEERSLVALLIADCPEGVEICQYISEFTTLMAPVAALVAEKEKTPLEVVERMSADGYLQKPCTTSALETFLSMGGRIAIMRQRLHQAERTLLDTQNRLREAVAPNTGTGFHHFDSVKDMLVVEVRRAKRYGYPLSVLMVGLDPVPAVKKATIQSDITGGLAVAIAKSIRAIDLPIQFAPDRILVFLPHTDLSGSEEVGRRIKRRIKRITYRSEGLTAELTASVGIAGVSVGDNISFSKLIKSASAALKAAQLKGGDKVMKRKNESPSAP